jgi:hypothetical protein
VCRLRFEPTHLQIKVESTGSQPAIRVTLVVTGGRLSGTLGHVKIIYLYKISCIVDTILSLILYYFLILLKNCNYMSFCSKDIDYQRVSTFFWTPLYIVLQGTTVHTVAYRPVAKQWLYEQRPFLGNGSVNTFPLLNSRSLIMQQLDYNNSRTVFSMWSVSRCYRQGARSV